MARAFGQTPSTTATTEVAVESTTYTEQTSGAQRALKSSSANDAAAGTGARQVKITYYTLASDGTIAGPFTEVVTLNGTAAVATVATNIALVEKLEVIAAGSGGVAAGTISLTAASDGTGTTIWSIAAAAVRTLGAHHYVPTGWQCRLRDVAMVGGNASAALFAVKALPYPSGVEQVVANAMSASSAQSVQEEFSEADPLVVVGPARVRMYTAPANSTAQVNYGGFGYEDARVSAS